MRCDRCGAYMRAEERTPYNGYVLHAECVPAATPESADPSPTRADSASDLAESTGTGNQTDGGQ